MSELSFKVILVGQSGVGKTAIVRRFTKRFFPADEMPTIGVDVGVRMIEADGVKIQMKIWDSAGSERFKSLTTSYYRNADAAIMVYSIDNCDSLYDLQSWSREVMNHSDAVRLLVGNKNDLEENREISQDIAINFALLENIEIAIECSAKEDDNVDFLFYTLAKKLIAKHHRNGYVPPQKQSNRETILQYPTISDSMGNLFFSPKQPLKYKKDGSVEPYKQRKRNIFQRFCTIL